jgi:hypothetical protein
MMDFALISGSVGGCWLLFLCLWGFLTLGTYTVHLNVSALFPLPPFLLFGRARCSSSFVALFGTSHIHLHSREGISFY